ncbi:NYN domain-containing protein [Nocardia rhamnosiphila]|uniref:NYN domain-containing protein n=1 Tax=Nocardia rhamnosiphila TaxID=426716 RepID=UPI0033D1F3A2
MADRIAVFLDYQNVHMSARDQFHPYGTPAQESLVHPLRVAESVVARRRYPSELAAVRVFRGRPNPEHQQKLTAANDAQTAAWGRDPRVQITRRDLNYRGWPEQPPREKGVDVALSIGLVECALAKEFDTLVVFSGDTDLLPALELVYYRTDTRLEIAAWSGAKPLWFPEELAKQRRMPYCHFLAEPEFETCRDLTPYV